jgi:hypothetical protein
VADVSEHMTRELAIGCREDGLKVHVQAGAIVIPLDVLDDAQRETCIAAACLVQSRQVWMIFTVCHG